ncbi:hypothetical protein VPH35_105914 [Triticum aestivum]
MEFLMQPISSLARPPPPPPPPPQDSYCWWILHWICASDPWILVDRRTAVMEEVNRNELQWSRCPTQLWRQEPKSCPQWPQVALTGRFVRRLWQPIGQIDPKTPGWTRRWPNARDDKQSWYSTNFPEVPD